MSDEDMAAITPEGSTTSQYGPEQPKPCSDEYLKTLMVRYQQADGAAAVGLVECLSPMLYRYLKQQLSTQGIAEDLLQECWLRIHRSRHSYRPGSRLLPWIFTIARRTRIDAFRAFIRREMREGPLAENEKATLARSPKLEANLDLWRCVEALTAIERETIYLLKVEGLSLEEVSNITGVSVTAIKQRAHRSYVKLRRALRQSK